MTSIAQAYHDRAAALVRENLVWDNVWPVDLKGGASVGNDWGKLDRFAAAGVDILGVTLASDLHTSGEALKLVAWARAHILGNADRYRLIESVADIDASAADRRLGVMLHFEGMGAFERSPELVEPFFRLGVRQTILAFNNANAVGGGCAEPDHGLTRFGRQMVAELQRVGMIVDLSHVGERTSLEALEMATRPMIFSHSNAHALHLSFRNITDAQVRACAATGGLVGLSGASAYLGDPACATATMFRHVDHFVQLVGAAHVGLGLDVVFDAALLNAYIEARPDEWPMVKEPGWTGFAYAMPEQVQELVGHMLAHGYAEADVCGILGGNYRRICAEAWTSGE